MWFLWLVFGGVSLGQKPNVILVMVDDLGYYDLGVYGHPKMKTPHLDRLAHGGVRLTDFYSGAAVCTPSRMALMTGSYPVRLGWRKGVAGYKMGRHDGMSGEALTIAEIFKSEGYVTAMSGKWHIGDQEDTDPIAQGFDTFYGLYMSNNQTKKLLKNRNVVEDPFENRLLTQKISDEALQVIRVNQDKPFFLYVPYTAPHFPVEAHPDWQGKSEFGVYGDVVEELDARLGAIFAELDKLGLKEKTIVVFCSDNGPNPGEMANCLPFRGEKWSALEGGTRVPCIISWPGKIPGGRVYDGLTSSMDLLPTLSEMCGIDWTAKSKGGVLVDGLSFWLNLKGEGKYPRDELLYWHGMHHEPQAIRVGNWKLFFESEHALTGSGTRRKTEEQAQFLERYDINVVKGKPMLFHLKKDAGELDDVSEQYPEKVKELRDRAAQIMKQIKEDKMLPLSTPVKN